MEITIDNYVEVLADKLKNGGNLNDDVIYFPVGSDQVLTYMSNERYLRAIGCSNRMIFLKLGITDKEAFCAKAYGYEPHGGDFPECRGNANVCLIRVTKALFDKCAERYIPVKSITISDLSVLPDIPETRVSDEDILNFCHKKRVDALRREDDPFFGIF